MSCHCLLAVITPSTLTCVSTDTICDWRSKCVDTHYQRKTVIGQEILSLNANKSILIATLPYQLHLWCIMCLPVKDTRFLQFHVMARLPCGWSVEAC
jgi:hypothetical protein